MGILQARVLEWVAMPSSRGSSQPRSPTLQADSLLSEQGRSFTEDLLKLQSTSGISWLFNYSALLHDLDLKLRLNVDTYLCEAAYRYLL